MKEEFKQGDLVLVKDNGDTKWYERDFIRMEGTKYYVRDDVDNSACLWDYCVKAPIIEKIYDDWRLPSIKQLLTLVDYKQNDIACVLGDTRCAYYWSSTTYANINYYAWTVHFGYGYSNYYYKANYYYVRCVRINSKGLLEWSKTSKEQMTYNEALEYAKNLKESVYYKGNNN